MDLSQLEKPFEDHLIKTRKGPGNKPLSYVEGHEYIRRLNEVFDQNWSFEIVEHHILDNEVVVLGKVTIDGIVKMAVGGSNINKDGEGNAINIGDALKSASTDALKKACSLFGLGLHLYGDNKPARQASNNRPRRTQKRMNGRQKFYIEKLWADLGKTPNDLHQFIEEDYRCEFSKLDGDRADKLIERLNKAKKQKEEKN